MATFRVWSNRDGSISCAGEIRIKRGSKIVFRQTETFRRKSEREARKLAERWAANRESELERPGVLDELIRQRDQPDESVTVRELIERYREAVFPLRPWSRSKEDTLRQIQSSEFGDLDAGRVISSDIIDHCRAWAERSSPATAMQHYIYIRGVWSVAKDLLRVAVDYSQVDAAHNVMTKLGIISKSARRERRPSVAEMTDIVRLAYERRMRQRDRNVQRADLIPMDKVLVFAMFSGRRQDEIGRITRSGTDYERRRVLVPDMKHPTKKRGNDVWCAVPDRAWRVLMSMPDSGDDCWFPFFPRTLGDRFRQLLKEAGHYDSDPDADNLRFHDLRHECASCLFELNGYHGQVWDVPRVADVTGHRDWGSLQRYTQIAQTEPYDKWQGWEWAERVLE
jgi:integrase